MCEEWLTSQKIFLRWISNSIKLYCNQSGCAVLRSVKQCLRETAATILWLYVLEGRLKTSPGRLWYSKQAKNALQWKQKPLYNIPRIHRLSYRERSWINLRKNSTSVTTQLGKSHHQRPLNVMRVFWERLQLLSLVICCWDGPGLNKWFGLVWPYFSYAQS